MEAVDGGSRSGIHSIINREQIERINTDRAYTANMAAPALASPSYGNGPTAPYSAPWSAMASHAVSGGLISPPESRRTSDNKGEPQAPAPLQTTPNRQSLPSIHEALNPGPNPNPYVSPVSASLPSSHQFPYSQSQVTSIPRSYAGSDHNGYPTHPAPPQPRDVSPVQPVHSQPASFIRKPEPTPATFGESGSRHASSTSLQPAPPPPHNPYAAPRFEPSRYEQDPRNMDRSTNGYTHNPPQHLYPYGPGPNQIGYPTQYGPTYNQPRYLRDGREPPDGWKVREDLKPETPAFKVGLKRNLDVWDLENNLSQVNVNSNALAEWSRHFYAIAQEQQRSLNGVPDRMPTVESCDEMLDNHRKMGDCLHRMRDTIKQQEDAAMVDQRMRSQGGKPHGDYEDEMSMYGDDMKNQGFGLSDGKKRRGRAAPPGRCHSCNRAETPEWRRGPDGARTLCNACGLHYAKLTRKNTMKQSQGLNGSPLRPKPMDNPSPRPL